MRKQMKDRAGKNGRRIVRYAVVGLGHIAQIAVLPAFAHAGRNSQVTALVSDDPMKRKKLGRQYGIEQTYSYAEYDECLAGGYIDAVYIALPNHLHCDYSVRAARAGIHVLCEKPMAVTEQECEQMIEAADLHRVKLMIAYRLHFEEANMKAAHLVQSGKLGEPRLFNSVFTMQVRDKDIRLQKETGGGTLYDIGIYCINAARYLFKDEPLEVSAFSVHGSDRRFKEVDEMTGATMRFPHDRLAMFICSFGGADVSAYDVVGTKGHLRVDPAYEYADKLKFELTLNGTSKTREFSRRDQFAPELLYFSDCILQGRSPEPSGKEGLIDVRIIRALYDSAETGHPVSLQVSKKSHRPTLTQEIKRPPVKKPHLIHTESPSL
jgi:glucose-fructose oxidoreductase